MPYLDREGVFEARPLSVAVVKTDKGAVMVNFEFEVLRQWNPEAEEWAEYPPDWTFQGNSCFRKTDGENMPNNIKKVADLLGWDGRFETLQGEQWSGITVQCKVKADTYNGKTRYKADYIDPQGSPITQGLKKSDDNTIAELSAMFGGLTETYAAEVGGIKPAPAPHKIAAFEPPPAAETPVTEDDVPF